MPFCLNIAREKGPVGQQIDKYKAEKLSKLKVGILIDDFKLAAWAYEMLLQIDNSHFAEISMVIKRRGGGPKAAMPWSRALYRLYRKVDRKMFPVKKDAFARKDIRDFLSPTIPVLEPAIKQTQFSDIFDEAACREIAQSQPDVLIRLGFRIIKGPILNIPRYGIWSYHHGDNLTHRGGPPGFWEVMQGQPATGSILQILSEKLDAGKVIYRSWSQTNPLSVHRNTNKVYWKSLRFIPRMLEQLHTFGPAALEKAIVEHQVDQEEPGRLYKPPGNLQMAGLWLKLILRNALRKSRERNQQYRWFLLAGKADSNWKPADLNEIKPPQDRFYADPFPAKHEGKTYIFFEDLAFDTGKGMISVGEWDGNRLVNIQTALEEPHHLSYPYLWKEGAEWLMLPESKEAGKLICYKAEKFPTQWKPYRVIWDGLEAADASIVHRDGLYWLFLNKAEQKGASVFDELFLYFSPSLDNPTWHTHPCNPIVSDVRRARMAGRPFQKDSTWFRPGQDCSVRYGYAITLHQIKSWTTTEYEEVPVKKILPDWKKDLKGTHTLNFLDDLVVMDAYNLR